MSVSVSHKSKRPCVVLNLTSVYAPSTVSPLAVSVVNAPVDAEDAPMVVPSIVPPLISMLVATILEASALASSKPPAVDPS